MTMDLRQTMNQQLSQKLLNAMSLLKLNIMDVREYTDALMAANIMVDIDESHTGEALSFPGPVHTAADMPDLCEDSFLRELLQEADRQPVAESCRRILRYLIYSLDDNGYLTESPAESAAYLGVTEAAVTEALSCLQTLEPAGIGAADLRECLLLQLKHGKGSGASAAAESVAAGIIRDHLPLAAEKKYGRIASLTGCSPELVREAVRLIETLNPKPFNGIPRRGNTFVTVPDLYVYEDGSTFRIRINETYRPPLRLRTDYLALLDDPSVSPEDRTLLRERFREAREAVDNLAFRDRTLEKVMTVIVSRQQDFFRLGPGHRRNLTNRDIAAALSLHESTVSRAVADKAFACRHGIFPLRYLLCRSGSDSSDHTGDLDRILNAIRTLIREEDPTQPLSDQALSDALAAEGMLISRRTCAKYRRNLGIPNAAERRS